MTSDFYGSLVLTRRPGEAVWIGDIRVAIGKMRGDSIQVHISAPKTIRIIREELLQDEPL